MPSAAGNQRCKARLQSIVVVLLGHRDAAVQAECLLHRGVVERDQREWASGADRAEPAVAFTRVDQLGVSVDLREGAVNGLVGVGDGKLDAVSGSVEAVPASRVAPRAERVGLPMQPEDDRAGDDVEVESGRWELAWRGWKPVDRVGAGRQDPCAFAAATSFTT